MLKKIKMELDIKPIFKIGDKVRAKTERYSTFGTVISVDVVEYGGKGHFSYGVENEYGSRPYLEKHLYSYPQTLIRYMCTTSQNYAQTLIEHNKSSKKS